MNKIRCAWCTEDKIYQDYHDKEWGVPVYDDDRLFEFLILEGAQAGLNWLTVLKKRENYRKAYNNFNPKEVSKYNEEKKKELLENKGIIRNKLKINSSIKNAKVFLEIQREFGSFRKYLWDYVDNTQIKNNFNNINEIPTKTELSDKISKDLKKRGMSFVGSTIIYAYMQAVGIVDDHTKDCFKYKRNK